MICATKPRIRYVQTLADYGVTPTGDAPDGAPSDGPAGFSIFLETEPDPRDAEAGRAAAAMLLTPGGVVRVPVGVDVGHFVTALARLDAAVPFIGLDDPPDTATGRLGFRSLPDGSLALTDADGTIATLAGRPVILTLTDLETFANRSGPLRDARPTDDTPIALAGPQTAPGIDPETGAPATLLADTPQRNRPLSQNALQAETEAARARTENQAHTRSAFAVPLVPPSFPGAAGIAGSGADPETAHRAAQDIARLLRSFAPAQRLAQLGLILTLPSLLADGDLSARDAETISDLILEATGEDDGDDEEKDDDAPPPPAIPDNAASQPNPNKEDGPPPPDPTPPVDNPPTGTRSDEPDPRIEALLEELRRGLETLNPRDAQGNPHPDYEELRKFLRQNTAGSFKNLQRWKEEIANALPKPDPKKIREIKSLPDNAVLSPEQIEHLRRNLERVLFMTAPAIATGRSTVGLRRLFLRDLRFRFLRQIPGAVEQIKRVSRILGVDIPIP